MLWEEEEKQKADELADILYSARRARQDDNLASYGGFVAIGYAVEVLEVAAIVWPKQAQQVSAYTTVFLPCGKYDGSFQGKLSAEQIDELLGGKCPKCQCKHTVRHLLTSTYFDDHFDTYVPFRRGVQEVEAEEEEEEEAEEDSREEAEVQDD